MGETREVPVCMGTLHKVTCTEMQIEQLPDGTVSIVAFQGDEPFAKFIARPGIVVVNNAAQPEIRTVKVIEPDSGDDIPF